ncbi:MAG: hypothetical protein MHM6MM_001023 [Cercozoa sp. M6MM]
MSESSASASTEPLVLKVNNLPMFWTNNHLGDLLIKEGVDCQRMLKRPKGAQAFLEFADEASMETAKAAFTRIGKVKSSRARIRVSRVPANQMKRVKKFGLVDWDATKHEAKRAQSKQSRQESKKPAAELPSAAHAVAPLQDTEYDPRQLRRKRRIVFKAMAGLQRRLMDLKKHELDKSTQEQHTRKFKYPWMTQQYARTPVVNVEGPVPSPQLAHYRNKVEFTFGIEPESKAPVLGFMRGRTADGICAVGRPDDVLPAPRSALAIARVLQTEFLENSDVDAKLRTPYHPFLRSGCLRNLMVRVTRAGQVMLMLQAKTSKIKVDSLKEHFLRAVQSDAMTQALRAGYAADVAARQAQGADMFVPRDDQQEQYIRAEETGQAAIVSVYLQEHNGVSTVADEEAVTTLIHGQETIAERMNGRDFDISPDSFFQVNTPAAEKLYSLVGDLVVPNEEADKAKKTVLWDVCCGTGTIGLVLADRVKTVVGVDIVPAAVEDARRNAKRNKIENAHFVAGPAERVLVRGKHNESEDNSKTHADGEPRFTPADARELLADESLQHVAVVDPPRPGLHASVLRALRESSLRRIVYVSCNPDSCAKDCETLMRPESNKTRGRPFRAVRCVAADLFPHCEHCESVLLLERCTDDELPVVINKAEFNRLYVNQPGQGTKRAKRPASEDADAAEEDEDVQEPSAKKQRSK